MSTSNRILEAFVVGVEDPLFWAEGVGDDVVLRPTPAIPAATLARIDRLHFSGTAGLSLVLPIVPTSLQCAKKVEHGEASLRISARVRCYIAPESTIGSPPFPNPFDEVSVPFETRLLHGNLGSRFGAMKWIGADTTPGGFNLASLTGDAPEVEIATSQPFHVRRWSSVVERIGLALQHLPIDGDENSPEFVQSIRVSFFKREGKLGSRFGMRFSSALTLDPHQVHRILPFGMTVPTDDLAVSGRRVIVHQRQPRSGDNSIDRYLGAQHWLLELDVTNSFLRDHWNAHIVTPYTDSLHTVEDGRPLTLLPRLFTKAAVRWRIGLSLLDGLRRGTIAKDEVVLRHTTSQPVQRKLSVFARSVVPRAGKTGIPTTLVFPGFATTDGDPLLAHARIIGSDGEPPVESGWDETDVAQLPQGFEFRVQHVVSSGAADATVRLGALELAFPAATPDIPTDLKPYDEIGVGKVEVRLRPGREAANGDVLPDLVHVEQLSLQLAVSAMRPGGQDDVPGEEFVAEFEETADTRAEREYEARFVRPRPLVLAPFGASAAEQQDEAQLQPADKDFVLSITEAARPSRSQTVSLALSTRKIAPRETSYDLLVIDPTPFLVARVQVRDFGRDVLGAVTSEIANFSTRSGSAWELSAGATGFDLVLPPQAVGEAMEKNRSGERGSDIEPGVPIDFRFSPNARLAIRPSPFRQRFTEAPWNLRRVLGFPGQRDPGAGVDRLDFELLYGMSCRVIAPGVRLAEIASRLGELAGRQSPAPQWGGRHTKDQGDRYSDARIRWSQLYAALRRRLAILEPWSVAKPEALVLDEGVDYRLRASAHLRFPVPLGKPTDAPDVPANAKDANGLAGGVGWGFESANIYNAVWRTPKSVSGLLARPFFSALGGYGFQKASFDRGLTTIYSDTAMGRAQSVTIERLGRIGVFWTRAKHVIVYERSVSPSRQFHFEQDELKGLPVLRKVQEYVEILEPKRAFPDLGAAAVTRGFVAGVEFPVTSRRINVSSRWGRDVGTTGWVVPLWARDAIPRDVYPKPQILLNVVGEQADFPIAIDEPEKLHFFTSTRPDLSADSDTWPAVESVDFAEFVSQAMEPPRSGFDKGDVTQPIQGSNGPYGADDQAIVRGTGAFTFGLQPGARPANVVAERTTAAIATQLGNVTLMRAIAKGTAVSTPPADALRDAAANAIAPVLAALQGPLGSDPAKFAERLKAELEGARTLLGTAKSSFDQLSTVLNGGGNALKKQLCLGLQKRVGDQFDLYSSELLTQIDAFRGALLAHLRALADEANDAWKVSLDKVKELIDSLTREVVDTLHFVRGGARDLARLVRRAKVEVRSRATAVRTHLGKADEVLPKWEGSVTREAEAAIAALRDFVSAGLRDVDWIIAEALRQAVGDSKDKIRAEIAKARKAIEDTAREISWEVREGATTTREAALAVIKDIQGRWDALGLVADQRLEDLAKDIEKVADDTQAPAELQRLVETFAAELKGAIQSSPKPLFAAFDDAARRLLSPDSPDLKAAIAGLRRGVLSEADRLCDLLFPDLAGVLGPLGSLLNGTWINDLQGQLGSGIRTVDQARAEIDAIRDEVGREVDRLLKRYVPALDGLEKKVPKEIIDSGLNLLRAFGEAPRVPNLDFRLPGRDSLYRSPNVGYYFDAAKRAVDLTPILAKANPLGLDVSALTPINLRVPSISLLDRVQPADLGNFDLSRVFPDFAGVRLDGLFSGLKLPSLATDRVKLTHGGDIQNGQGWLQVDVDVPFTDSPITVFSFAAVTLRLLKARFQATTRIEAAPGQPPRQTFRGSITGDWDIVVAGFPIAVLVDTSLEFQDGGRIRFNVSPDRVRLQAVLSFLTELLSQLGYSDSGFSIRILPTGVQSILDLPLPDVQAGTFGLANLHLGCVFDLLILPEFALAARIYLGSKKAPFTLTVFILGGAGWIDVYVKYTPTTGAITTTVSVGLTAAASLAIAAGPIRGGIYAYFGIAAEYEASTQGYSSLRVGLLLLFRGEVCLLGFLSVGLSLSLEAQYQTGGGLIGRGRVSYSVKICWCVTINVSADIEYVFARASGGGRARAVAGTASVGVTAPNPYQTQARRYVDMFR